MEKILLAVVLEAKDGKSSCKYEGPEICLI